jgi:hypothetical protein
MNVHDWLFLTIVIYDNFDFMKSKRDERIKNAKNDALDNHRVDI